jgi:hypothetical protein
VSQKRVTVVTRTGQPLRRDWSSLGARTGLQHVEEPEADRLLNLRITVDLEVGHGPELVEIFALVAEQAVPSVVSGPGQGRRHLAKHRRLGTRRRPAVAEVLHDAEPLPRFQFAHDAGARPIVSPLAADFDRCRRVNDVVHSSAQQQPAAACPVQQHGARRLDVTLDRGKWAAQRGRDAGIAAHNRGRRLVRDELRLDDHPDPRTDRLHLVGDRGDGAMRQRHQPSAAHPHRRAGRRPPHDFSAQRARPQIEPTLVTQKLAIADVEGLVVDEQPDELAVRHVDHGLARLGIPVACLRIRERAKLEEPGHVGAGHGMRLALVEISAQPDVAVGQREQRLGLRKVRQVEFRLAHAPVLDWKRQGVAACLRSRWHVGS